MTETLYRKYRPKTFSDVVGQDHVVSVLKNAIANKAVVHAYLFAGSRGTGKTSVARIFAHELGTTDTDLYEIDAASNRGIDDIRALREAVYTAPFESSYKIYIVDECHMLTKDAFNALLKTLEEPPSHVLFVLATTELQKVPETIISRCEVHQFRQPSRQELKEHLIVIAGKEGYTLEHSAGELLALLAEGSFRDGQGLLQKVIGASSDKKISEDTVARVVSAPAGVRINTCIEAIEGRDIDKALSLVQESIKDDVDIVLFVRLLIEKVRAVLLLRVAPTVRKTLEDNFSSDDIQFLNKCAENKESQITAHTLAVLLQTYSTMQRTALPAFHFELALIDLLSNNTN